MNTSDLELLLRALSDPDASFVLGAGASAPDVPTFAQLAQKIAGEVGRLSSFPASTIPDSGLRALMQPVIDLAKRTSDLQEWKAGSMTTATIAVVLQQIISRAHLRSLPQYRVFALLPLTGSIVSFNWDGLALARCQQRIVVHPHGIVFPAPASDSRFSELLWQTQSIDEPSARHWYLPGLVLPGEEGGAALSGMREKVLKLWMKAASLVVVGYSFGLSSQIQYDAVWLDTFVEVCSRNREVPVHIIAPDALRLRQAICDRIGRSLNIFAWSLRWDVLSRVMLDSTNGGRVPISALRLSREKMESMVRRIGRLSE